MLSESQQQIYDSAKDFVIGKLDLLLGKCKTEGGKKAMGFVVGVMLEKDFDTTQSILNKVYGGEKFKMVRSLFETMHKLINGEAPNHLVVKPIYDPRLFSAASQDVAKVQQALVKEVAILLSDDIRQWNHDKYQQGIFKESDFQMMSAHYYDTLFPKETAAPNR